MGQDKNHLGQIEFDLLSDKRDLRRKYGSYEVKIIDIPTQRAICC